jgi:hypothetical protein
MNPRTTGILLLATAALGAFVYFYEIEGEQARQAAEEAGRRLFPDVEQEAIASLSLETSDGSAARLERRDGGWALVEPVAFPADAFAADGLASNLAGLTSESVLEDPQPAKEYGLGEGARVVRFSAGDVEQALRIGGETPIGSNSYVQVEGSDSIVTVATFKASSFEKSLTELRERRILEFDANAVRRIDARWPGAAVSLARASPGVEDAGEEAGEAPAEPDPSWNLTAPLEGRADGQAVDRLLSDLSFLRADDFVDDPSEEMLAGFDPPAYEVELHGEAVGDEAAPSWRLAVGPLHAGDKRLVRGAQASLYAIPAERLADFPREVVAYRFKRLADFAIGDAFQVDFFFHPPAGDPVAVTAERTDDGWVSAPQRLAPAKLARLVSELSSLEAGDILSEDASEEELQRLGLAPPRTILSVFGAAPEAEGEAESAGAPRLAEIHVGNVEGSEWIIARAAGDPAVYRLEYELAEHLPLGLEAFRNRFLAEDEPAAPAEEIEELPDFLTPSEESP